MRLALALLLVTPCLTSCGPDWQPWTPVPPALLDDAILFPNFTCLELDAPAGATVGWRRDPSDKPDPERLQVRVLIDGQVAAKITHEETGNGTLRLDGVAVDGGQHFVMGPDLQLRVKAKPTARDLERVLRTLE